MAKLVAHHADGRDGGVEQLGHYGVSPQLYAVEALAVDHTRVRPYVVGIGGALAAMALVHDGETVEHTVAVVVKVAQVYLGVEGTQSLDYHVLGTARAVCMFAARESDPAHDGGGDVEGAV